MKRPLDEFVNREGVVDSFFIPMVRACCGNYGGIRAVCHGIPVQVILGLKPIKKH
jgi:hypothetical protein